MSDYRAGTVAVTQGSAAVTGTNTLWGTGAGPIKAGDEFGVPAGDGTPPTAWYTIQSVNSDGSLTLVDPYRGTTNGATAYRVRLCSASRDSVRSVSVDLAAITEKIVRLLGDIRIASKQMTLDKTGAAAISSLLHQQDGTSQWRSGTFGNSTWKLQRSTDGSSWTDVLSVPLASGEVTFGSPATTVQIEKFTTSGTWTKPAWAKRVRVEGIAGGAGGGSGGLRGAGVAVAGGGGGSPGGFSAVEFLASEVAGTVNVTVGAGGAGGAAISANDGDGAVGGDGGFSRFGSTVVFRAGTGGAGGGASAGAGGQLATNLCYPPMNAISAGSGAVGVGGAGGLAQGRTAPGAGGGGGVSAAEAAGLGGGSPSFGHINSSTVAGSGGGTSGGAFGSAGTAVTVTAFLHASGSGGGGAAGVGVNGGAGGAGAAPGGAGGGGGASRNGRTSGKGGDGARGEVWVISMG